MIFTAAGAPDRQPSNAAGYRPSARCGCASVVRIRIVAATSRQPAWVDAACAEFAKRLRGNVLLELQDVPLTRRRGGALQREAIQTEGDRLLAAVPKGAHIVALHETGAPWSSLELARKLQDWMAIGSPVGLLIGGPDGLSRKCLDAADAQWSLSPLTLPHGIAKILVAEAVYRAWTILQGHPYHRA